MRYYRTAGCASRKEKKVKPSFIHLIGIIYSWLFDLLLSVVVSYQIMSKSMTHRRRYRQVTYILCRTLITLSLSYFHSTHIAFRSSSSSSFAMKREVSIDRLNNNNNIKSEKVKQVYPHLPSNLVIRLKHSTGSGTANKKYFNLLLLIIY